MQDVQLELFRLHVFRDLIASSSIQVCSFMSLEQKTQVVVLQMMYQVNICHLYTTSLRRHEQDGKSQAAHVYRCLREIP